jgi:hypothetical protein
MDERLLRTDVSMRSKTPELVEITNLALLKGEEAKLPFVVVGRDVYCVADRYQCKFGNRVPNYDTYFYYCPECESRYKVRGQDFVDWCKFKEDGIVR